MKSFLTICFLFSALGATKAAARSITIEVSNELTFQSIRSYEDGMTFITRPKMYDYYIGSATKAEAELNALVVCKKLGMKFFDQTTFQFLDGKMHRTVLYTPTADGQAAAPSFVERPHGLQLVICER